jgi:transcriptional regulator GlxA family with amidase domain
MAHTRLAELPLRLERTGDVSSAARAVLQTLSPIRREQLRAAAVEKGFFGRLEQFVEDRLDETVSLQDAARAFGMTPSTLTRRVERRYQVTFTGYVARRRIARAKALLQRTQLSVDDIARRAGFVDGAHLRKQLQRFEGTTPSRLRANRKDRNVS